MRSAGCVALWLRFFARTWLFDLDFARSDGLRDAPRTLQGSTFKAETMVFSTFFASASTLPHDLPTLTKHCVGARISSFVVFAIVPTSGENLFRTLLREGFALATRSRRAQQQPKVANLAPETAKLTPRTANLAAKHDNLAAQTTQLGVPRPFQTHFGASLSRPRAPKPPKIEISSIFCRFHVLKVTLSLFFSSCQW